jgi:predicted ATP-dependent endonuclease of OLD family
MRARIYNQLHEMTVPFSDRSAGFIWFFSFLVSFSHVKEQYGDVVILLDEPGLNLHGRAQGDLLRYFDEKLKPTHQLLYTTHSPFMVPADHIERIRTVEDVVEQKRRFDFVSHGTKVGDDVLSTDRDTVFPLQAALGYEITQSLFVGEHTLLVEGPSDILYI